MLVFQTSTNVAQIKMTALTWQHVSTHMVHTAVGVLMGTLEVVLCAQVM